MQGAPPVFFKLAGVGKIRFLRIKDSSVLGKAQNINL